MLLRDSSWQFLSFIGTWIQSTAQSWLVYRLTESALFLGLVSFAECLTAEKVKMYGAYWCPHCTTQKNLFGEEAFSKVNYIECDANGENGNPTLCTAENIKAYPTWEFADESRVEGTMELSDLAQKTQCGL